MKEYITGRGRRKREGEGERRRRKEGKGGEKGGMMTYSDVL